MPVKIYLLFGTSNLFLDIIDYVILDLIYLLFIFFIHIEV